MGDAVLDTYNIAAITITLVLMLGYSFTILYIGTSKLKTTNKVRLAVNIKNAVNWTKKHIETADAANDTLAIQTLRNTIIVAVFTGGYAFDYAFTTANEYDSSDSIDRRVRSRIVSAILFLSFLSWVSVIRLSSQLGFLIGSLSRVPNQEALERYFPSDIDKKDDKENSAKVKANELKNVINSKESIRSTAPPPSHAAADGDATEASFLTGEERRPEHVAIAPSSSQESQNNSLEDRNNDNNGGGLSDVELRPSVDSSKMNIVVASKASLEAAKMLTIYFSLGFRYAFVKYVDICTSYYCCPLETA